MTKGPSTRWRPFRRPTGQHGVSVASKLAATMLVVGLVSLLAATVVGINAGQRLGEGIIQAELSSSATSGAEEVAGQLNHYRRLVQQLAGSPQAAEAIDEFSAALEPLEDLSKAEIIETRQQLLEAYQERFFDPLRDSGQIAQVRDVLATDPAAVYLQGVYSVPVEPVTDPATVTDPGDGSDWSGVHARFHPVYRTTAREAGLRDVYLVDATSERVVYSSAKGPDLGTSLAVGPYSGTIVARAADAARDSDAGVVVDLGFYVGAPGGPIGAAAAPVRDGDQLVGAVVLTYDADVLSERLYSIAESTVDEPEDGSALYVIGSDGTNRSDPQAFVDSPSGYLDAAAEAGGLSEEDRTRVELAGTTILLQPAADATLNAARDGITEPSGGTGIAGLPVVNTVLPVDDPDVTWYVVRELDAEKAGLTVDNFRRILLIGTAVFMVVLAFASVAWAAWFTRPLRIISVRLGQASRSTLLDATPEPVTIPDRSSIELHRLADSLTLMGGALVTDQRAVRDAREERLAVLSRMLPESVAHRIARGDVDAFEEIPNATVAVVVVLGLGELLSSDPSIGRGTIDALHAEIDAVAADHGLDRIKVLGDAYFAACGHDRPYIDHAPRVVAFATEVAGVVDHAVTDAGAVLSAASGVASGPVTVGMSGRDRLVYDVWGPTVATAHTLARCARPDEVLMTESTRDRLPQDVVVEAEADGSRFPDEWRDHVGVFAIRTDSPRVEAEVSGVSP